MNRLSAQVTYKLTTYSLQRVSITSNTLWTTTYLRSAEPNCAADPIPNSPRVLASNLLRSAMAGMPELKLITAAVANAVETNFPHFFDSCLVLMHCLLEQSSFSTENSVRCQRQTKYHNSFNRDEIDELTAKIICLTDHGNGLGEGFMG